MEQEKRLVVIQVPDLNWPVTLEIPSKRFRLFVAANITDVSTQTISDFSLAALNRGMVYFCSWGPDCERFHDIVDEVVVEDDIDKRKFAGASISVVVVGLCWTAWGIRRNRQLDSGFNAIKHGDSESEVVRLLGRPKRVEHCGDFMGPLEKREAESCANEYLYASSFSPILPQYYIVRFDGHGRVSSTASYSSP